MFVIVLGNLRPIVINEKRLQKVVTFFDDTLKTVRLNFKIMVPIIRTTRLTNIKYIYFNSLFLLVFIYLGIFRTLCVIRPYLQSGNFSERRFKNFIDNFFMPKYYKLFNIHTLFFSRSSYYFYFNEINTLWKMIICGFFMPRTYLLINL